jgi:putative peptidoglycan lipid II flippase
LAVTEENPGQGPSAAPTAPLPTQRLDDGDDAAASADDVAKTEEPQAESAEPNEDAVTAALALKFLPGTRVAGRYDLLAAHGGVRGGAAHLRFWQAFDVVAGQHVALTLVDPDGGMPVEQVNEILARTVVLKGLDTPGAARVLDVLHTGRYGVVVADWVRGGNLRQVADTSPSPAGVAGAMLALVAAAEAAHRGGLALGVDHPDRLRISTDGHAMLAFPATLADATPQRDIRGIGNALYALLVGRWPDGDADGWPGVRFDAAQRPQEPADLDPDIPFLISATAAGALRPDGGIDSASTLLALLREAAHTPVDDEPVAVPPSMPPATGGYAEFAAFGPAERSAEARRRLVRVGIGTAAAALVIALALVASNVGAIFGDDTDGMDQRGLGLNDTVAAPASPAPAPAPGGEPIKPVKAAVFSPDGSPDSPEQAAKAIDGDPNTSWQTDTYFDADPFPKFKSGVGLMVQLPQPATPRSVVLDVDSTGTVVQIRSARSASPGSLADTTELSKPTPVRPGRNTIELSDPAPTSNIVVWITKLGSTAGKNRADIGEVAINATVGPA